MRPLPTFINPYFAHRLALLLLVATFCFLPTTLFSQEHPASVIEKISVGFSDATRLGHWTPLSVKFGETNSQTSRPTHFEILCLDGEGIPVTYRGKLDYDLLRPSVAQGWFRMGRKSSDIDVRLTSGDKSTAQTFQLVADKDFAVYPATTKLVLAIESEPGLRELIDIGSQNAGGGRVVIGVESASFLPMNALAYQGVDQIYLSTREMDMVEQLSDLQIAALRKWIEDGGNLVFSVGQGGEAVFGTQGKLAKFCPGKFDGVGQLNSASRLQFFANSESNLIEDGESFPVTEVVEAEGVTQLAQDGMPIIIQQARGFGTITFTGVDIDSPVFLRWKGIGSFVKKLFFGGMETTAADIKNISGGRVSHYGYDDIIGQVRVPLDQFTRVRFVTFTWVAVLIGLYILCIGPGDYFLLRKLIGRMEMTWLTFGLMTLGFCGIAVLMARSAKPNRIQVNQLEIIDVDAVSGRTRGFVWANLFSPATKTHDIMLASTNRLGNEIDSRVITWQGLPGNGLGGMQSSASTTLAAEGYTIDIESDEKGVATALKRFPLRVSSSKPVFARWDANNATAPRSRLRVNERINQIDGTLTNPFDQPLRNCRLMFENGVYVVEGKLEPGETIDVLTETREKNIRSYFTRRISKDDKGSNTAWDPTDTDIPRIADIMMFYEGAGGQGYIGLTNSYQSFTDLSQICYLNRAILVGELQNNTSNIVIDGEAKPENYDRKFTFVRVVLPVERGNK